MRLMAKTLSYGVVHIAVAATVAFVLSGNWMIAVGIGLLEPVVQMAIYPLHEWLWERRKDKAQSTITHAAQTPAH